MKSGRLEEIKRLVGNIEDYRDRIDQAESVAVGILAKQIREDNGVFFDEVSRFDIAKNYVTKKYRCYVDSAGDVKWVLGKVSDLIRPSDDPDHGVGDLLMGWEHDAIESLVDEYCGSIDGDMDIVICGGDCIWYQEYSQEYDGPFAYWSGDSRWIPIKDGNLRHSIKTAMDERGHYPHIVEDVRSDVGYVEHRLIEDVPEKVEVDDYR